MEPYAQKPFSSIFVCQAGFLPCVFLILNQGTLAFSMRLNPVVFEGLGHGYINKTPKEVFVVMRFANSELFAKQTKTNV